VRRSAGHGRRRAIQARGTEPAPGPCGARLRAARPRPAGRTRRTTAASGGTRDARRQPMSSHIAGDSQAGDPGPGAPGTDASAPRLVLATHNEHKIRELREILAVDGLEPQQIVGAGDVGAADPVEDGITFAESALIKARAVAAHSGLPAIADDAGLAVDVRGGAPGIFSARWSGRHGADQENLDLLLAQLAEVPQRHRGAGFVCAAALVTPDGIERVEIGELRGTLLTAERGTGGFGYDPILQPEGEQRSCAELTPQEKNAISHRGRAFRALGRHVRQVLE